MGKNKFNLKIVDSKKNEIEFSFDIIDTKVDSFQNSGFFPKWEILTVILILRYKKLICKSV